MTGTSSTSLTVDVKGVGPYDNFLEIESSTSYKDGVHKPVLVEPYFFSKFLVYLTQQEIDDGVTMEDKIDKAIDLPNANILVVEDPGEIIVRVYCSKEAKETLKLYTFERLQLETVVEHIGQVNLML